MSRYREGRTWSGMNVARGEVANGKTVRVTIFLLTDIRSRVGSSVPLVAEFDAEAISDVRERHLAHPGAFTHNVLDLAIVDRLDQARYHVLQIGCAATPTTCRSRSSLINAARSMSDSNQTCAPVVATQ